MTWQRAPRRSLPWPDLRLSGRGRVGGEFGQHVAHDLGAQYARLMAMRAAGRDVEHIARSGLDRMIVETIADAPGQHEDRVAGFAPLGVRRARKIWRTLLITQRNAETTTRLAALQPA